ncbi:afadin- and alpha-actinin-binding protein B isoform X1 [Onychostoma macrolepis]|uniref:afadin- and alpha-actinin-binding protein B isoform X1 n=1 Tax=Onychostoma macrolepis TaxID=369639 RepID=UPI00272A1A60|nr:afadin- and alpha-actinin-binding protein B isoform X1 [Onychostoma macrolepis]
MAHKRVARSPTSHLRAQDCSEMLNSVILPLCPDESTHSSSHRTSREERRDLTSSLQEQLLEKDLHISRLQDTLTSEREKCARLQGRCHQQGAELKRREQQIQRMREKLSQLADRHKPRGASIEIINVLPKQTGRREPGFKTARADGRTEEALRLLLDRREAELREAMKLRHGLTTLLHMLRNNMEQVRETTVRSLQISCEKTLRDDNSRELEDETDNALVQSERSLGDHVTGGVVQEWTQVQKRLWELMSKSPVAQGTDQEKLLAHLEEELEQSRQLIRAQQQLLQDSVTAPLPAVLMDCYYLEEWERLQDHWEEFNRQRRSFQQERQAFTEAAIRLGHERCEFERQKASRMMSDFFSLSPVKKTSQWNRRESTVLGDLRAAIPEQLSLSPCATPSSEGSEVMPGSRLNMVMTPNTPELYSALKLPYYRSERILQSPDERNTNWPF